MPVVPDDVTVTDWPYSVGLFLMALVALVSCSRESPDGPPSSSGKTKGTAQGHPTAPVWVVDPQDPGSHLPPAGRSLFDYLVTKREGAKTVYKVPFPFTALIHTIEQQVGTDAHRSPLKRVLIPLNRSLQRHAARPEFFKYPRAVLGIDTEPPLQAGSSGLLLKDRLFLGYQEKANIIEAISYNEAAGRFEFQVVRDYRPGGNPKVLYANRAICTVCHQNHGPIFARPLWDETNANPTIAALLQEQRRDFYQFPIHQGIDVPNALDDATDRANEFSAAQLLWQEGCERAASQSESINCRADILRFLLQYRLSGLRGFDTRSPRFTDQFAPRFLQDWEAKWPDGLLIPNPDILNRNPMDFFQSSGPRGIGRIRISSDDGRDRLALRAVFEPSVPRGPIATWSAAHGLESVHRVIAGLSNFVAEADMRRLDAHLFQQTAASGRPERRYEAACRFTPRRRAGSIERLTFRCVQPERRTDGFDGGVAMEGVIHVNAGKVNTGTIDHLVFSDGDDLTDLEIVRGDVTEKRQHVNGRLEVTQQIIPLHAIRTDGNAVKEITFQVDGTGERDRYGNLTKEDVGKAAVMVLNNFGEVHHAIDMIANETLSGASDVLARKPFRRARIMKALFEHVNMPRVKWCCVDTEGMPDALADLAVLPDVSQPMANEGDETIPAIKAFRQYCARCHQGEDTFPPNFLHGSAQEVQAQVNHCAERIFFRLEMWRLRAPERPETPMPPVNALRRLSIAPEQWATHADLAVLKNYAAEVLKVGGDKPPRLEDLVAQGYDNLRECLPASQDQLVSGVLQ